MDKQKEEIKELKDSLRVIKLWLDSERVKEIEEELFSSYKEFKLSQFRNILVSNIEEGN